SDVRYALRSIVTVHIYCKSCFFFFFSSRRRHTRSYGDWSSDVCSSDLHDRNRHLRSSGTSTLGPPGAEMAIAVMWAGTLDMERRSEERRVGKECRSRWGTSD